MRREYHGGQNARDWRRKVAALARARKESVLTYKFKLDVQDGDIDFDAAARAYDVTEGIARGSLIGLVCAVHLSGFRLFSKAAETRRFVNRSRYPEAAFAEALRAHTKITNPKVTIQSIENFFTTRRRKARSWSRDELARLLFRSWNTRQPKDGEPEFSLAQGIADEVVRSFSEWSRLADDVTGALACADRHLASLGASFPKLGCLLPEAATQPESCTIAYDPESPFVDMTDNEQIWVHQMIAVCAGRLRKDNPEIDVQEKELHACSVTGHNQYNGLSWLFGNGLRYFRGSSVDRIAEDLRVPTGERRRVEQLKAFADAIPDDPFFDADGYDKFRVSVGMKITSWVSNYWKRLRELRSLHSLPPKIVLPQGLQDAENDPLFSGQHTDAKGLTTLLDGVPARIEKVVATLAVLSGGGIPEPKHMETVETVAGELTALAGQLAMLDNRINQEVERTEDKERVKVLESLRPSIPQDFKEPPKLNNISGGTDDADGEIQRLETGLNETLRERRAHFQRLAEWAGGDVPLDPFPVLEERERKALSDRKMDVGVAAEYALRHLLHRIAAMSRRLSPRAAEQVRDALTAIFLDKKDANRYFHNRHGALYRHPSSTSRHQAYQIDLDRTHAIDWLARLDERAAEIHEELRAVPNADHARFRDLLLIEEFIFTTRLHGLPEFVPGHMAKPDAKTVSIPPLLAAQLDAENVSRDVTVRAFNLFNTATKGLMFRVFRDGFIVRTKFQRVGRNELFYVPKDKRWDPPAGYSSAKGGISKGLALPAVVRDRTGVLPRETVEGLSKVAFPEGSRALLCQAPHDWFVELDLRGGTVPDQAGLSVKKDTTKKNAATLSHWRTAKSSAFRLKGPPSFKTWLDRALTNSDMEMGEHTLILDRSFKQSVRLEGEKAHLSAEPSGIRADLAIPITDRRSYPQTEPDLLFDNVVAIDLGERRIGYAIFSLTKFVESGCQDPFEVGSVAIPTFRKLQAAVRRHRGARQPNQKVGQTYSKALMQFRENVVGDVCNRIDTLCERFRGFPILESSVGNFETGGRQLEMIYGSVLRRYVYSEVDAHKTLRRQHWFTADTWEHPYVHTRTWNTREKQYSGSSKPRFSPDKVAFVGTSEPLLGGWTLHAAAAASSII